MPAKPRRPNPTKKRPPKKLVPAALGKSAPQRTDKSRMELVWITPSIAKKWLECNTENRPMGAQKLAEVKRSLELGLWTVNGETIKFCELNILRDGQTRLTAIVESGVAAWCWVCYDLDPKVFDTIDQGRNRNLGQLLAIRKRRNYNALAHAIRTVYQLSEDIKAESGGFVPRVGLTILEDRPDIEQSLDFVFGVGIKDVLSVGTAAALHYLMRKVDPERADAYWEALGTGVITNQRSPIRVVRDMLLRNRGENGDRRLTPTHQMAIVIKGWRLYVEGRTCKYIRWNGVESFPQIA